MANLRAVLRSKTFIILAVVAVLLIGLRIALEPIVEHYANKKLDELEGYSGHIEDVDIALLRGAYVIEGLRITKTGGKVPVPFLSASRIDLSVQWSALLDGAVVAEIEVSDPKLNFVNASEKEGKQQASQSQVEPSENWTDVVKDLVPISINRFSIENGRVSYRDFTSSPQVNIFVQDLYAEARNLTNSEDRTGSLVASFDGRALAMGSGRIKFDGKVDPYAKKPTFEAAFKLDGLEMKELNSYLRAYAKVDAEKGKFSMDAEFAAKKGRFDGYVKPFIKDLDVLDWGKEEESVPNKIWQGIVGTAASILENPKKDQTATRIPIGGRLDNPEVGVWSALGSLLKNAFIQALTRGLEGTVDIQQVSGKEDKPDDQGDKPSEGKDAKAQKPEK
jgi:hypothetical protein